MARNPWEHVFSNRPRVESTATEREAFYARHGRERFWETPAERKPLRTKRPPAPSVGPCPSCTSTDTIQDPDTDRPRGWCRRCGNLWSLRGRLGPDRDPAPRPESRPAPRPRVDAREPAVKVQAPREELRPAEAGTRMVTADAIRAVLDARRKDR